MTTMQDKLGRIFDAHEEQLQTYLLLNYTKRYLQSDCKHHILGDNALCSKTCDKDNSQT